MADDRTDQNAVSLAEAKRRRGASVDGRCACGAYRAVCSPMGRACCYRTLPGSSPTDG